MVSLRKITLAIGILALLSLLTLSNQNVSATVPFPERNFLMGLNIVMTTVAMVMNGRFVEEKVTFDTLDFFNQPAVAHIDAEQPITQP